MQQSLKIMCLMCLVSFEGSSKFQSNLSFQVDHQYLDTIKDFFEVHSTFAIRVSFLFSLMMNECNWLVP